VTPAGTGISSSDLPIPVEPVEPVLWDSLVMRAAPIGVLIAPVRRLIHGDRSVHSLTNLHSIAKVKRNHLRAIIRGLFDLLFVDRLQV
jgi:hypothetical protein